MAKTALIYYTFEGNTGFIAEELENRMDLDVFRLLPDKEPPRSGIGKFPLGGKSALAGDDVKLAPLSIDVNAYDNLILAFPVWAGRFPPAILSFLKQYKIEDKNLFVIANSASGKGDAAINAVMNHVKNCRIVGSLSLRNPMQYKDEARGMLDVVEKAFG